MKSLKLKSILGILFVSLLYVSCTRELPQKTASLILPDELYEYDKIGTNNSNATISSMINDESRTYYDNETVTLGRVLFYDTKMSINNSVSCGSCHVQNLGFADGSRFSTGFANKSTHRNSMSITNPVQNNKMFWDSRAENPYELSLMPVFNHLEMGMESDEMLVKKISSGDYYTKLFKDAFGTEVITKERISIAMSCFINSMYSKNSKWDQVFRDEGVSFTPEENLGYQLFNSAKFQCAACHAGDNFNSQKYYNHFSSVTGTANIGLDEVYADKGADNGSFKIPSLRNVAITGPYMHDGRYTTLREVIEHYAHNVKDNKQLDPRFRNANGTVKRIEVSDIEIDALVAFMRTLTDESFISDPKFSNPFK